MLWIMCLMPQKISVGSGVEESPIAVEGLLSNGKRDGTIRVETFDVCDQADHFLIRIIRILSALQYEGSESQFISGLAAGEDIFFREPIASGAGVAPADSAVETIVFAVVGEFDQSADIDAVSVMAVLFFPCQCEEILCEIRGAPGDQADPFVFRQLPGVS